jgi:hypothetical protein
VCDDIQNIKTSKKGDKLKFYKITSVHTPSYVNEMVIKMNKTITKTQAATIKFLKRVKGCTRLENIKIEYIRTEVG